MALLRPAKGVGVDFSPTMIKEAKGAYPELEWIVGDAENDEFLTALGNDFDFVVLSDMIGFLDDSMSTFEHLHRVFNPKTRLVVAIHSHLWEPVLSLASANGVRMPMQDQSWISLRTYG